MVNIRYKSFVIGDDGDFTKIVDVLVRYAVDTTRLQRGGLLNWFIQKHFIIKELNLFEIKFVDKIRLQNAKMANVVIDDCINVHSRL